jgi:circadian clock protein KaiB
MKTMKTSKTAKKSRQPAPQKAPKKSAEETVETWELRLYTAGQSPKSMAAYINLKKICEEHLHGRYTIEVIDLLKHPKLASGDQIVAIPTLIRKLPEPLRRIVGDLGDAEKALVGLQLKPGV